LTRLKLLTIPSVILGLLLLGSCTNTQTDTSAQQSASSSSAEPMPSASVDEDAEIEYGSFSQDQLYATIISELTGQQGNLEDATDGYFRLAFETRDLSIIRRASQFATASGDINALVQLGILWTEVAPEQVEPHLMLSYQLLEAGRFEDAANHMSDVINLGGEIDFGLISARTQRLQPARRQNLIGSLRQLHELYPQVESIHYAIVEMLDQNQQTEDALVELQILRQNYGGSPPAYLIEAQLLQSLEQSSRSLRVLRSGVREYPLDKPLRFTYARYLIQEEDFETAMEQFEILLEQDPEDFEALYSMALLEVELENFIAAEEGFHRLIEVEHRVSESHFYLGYIGEQEGDRQQSIDNYRLVQIGSNNFVTAQQQATRFAIELGRFEEAHRWLVELSRGQPRLEVVFANIESGLLMQAGELDRAGNVLGEMLQRYPNDTDLLFSRVLLHDSRGDMESAEEDLRRIIVLQPEDPRALNHLGYMLADRTDRFQEALELVERAIALSPDDPAIIDSLGWAQYKLGRYEEALDNLRRAYEAFPDHEVAAHLGEVLWVMGRNEEAMVFWEQGLESTPDSEIVNEAMERLMP